MGGGQWIREKKTDCGGEWRTVELFAVGEQEHKQARRKKCRESSPRQKNKNKMESLRRKLRKVLANFDQHGFFAPLPGRALLHLPCSLLKNPASASGAGVWIVVRRKPCHLRLFGMPCRSAPGFAAGRQRPQCSLRKSSCICCG